MKTSRNVVLALSLVLSVQGCGDASSRPPITSSGEAARRSAAEDTDATAQRLARAFALALSREDVRVQVRNAMRASLVTEHKLVLREFAATPAGRHLVRAAAEATGTFPGAVEAMISALPEMDFYAPFREHRRTWRATPDVVVAATLAESQALTGYHIDGRAVVYGLRDGVPAEAVLVMHPAERKSRRVRPQASRPGAVIQDRDDGEISGSLVWRGRDGRVRETSLADMDSGVMCDPASFYCGGGAEGGLAPADTTFVDHYEINYGDGFGGAEIELRATYYTSGGVAQDQGKLRYEGVYPDTPIYPHDPLIFRKLSQSSTDYIEVKVVETDVASDDDKGSYNFVLADRGLTRTIRCCRRYLGGHLGTVYDDTDVELDWVPKY